MVLALDIGNSTVGVGMFDGPSLKVRKFGTHPPREAAWYLGLLRDMLAGAGALEAVSGVVAASVVPSITEAVLGAARELTGLEPVLVGPGRSGGLGFDIENPGDLGPDRIASAVAAAELVGAPCVVLDFGTATTVNFIGEGPVFSGGAIMPGMSLMGRSLHRETAQLPEVPLGHEAGEGRAAPLGRTTEQNILSGIIYGTAGAVGRIIREVEALKGVSYRVAATGGLVGHVLPYLERVDLAEPDLTLKGLAIIYEREAQCTN